MSQGPFSDAEPGSSLSELSMMGEEVACARKLSALGQGPGPAALLSVLVTFSKRKTGREGSQVPTEPRLEQFQ